ncbi:hypothetical protein BMS3Bbin06_00001 [bacterium BMS3Bbin06]|nr:hypothetical protein BMS3Bbin06_00001 [bacterium BMS3Bbin06]
MVILPVAFILYSVSMSSFFCFASDSLAAISSLVTAVEIFADDSANNSLSIFAAICAILFCWMSLTLSLVKTAPLK